MWTNYGDVNPLEHGGIWLEKDQEHCYRVVLLDTMDEKYLFRDCYVDISGEWIKWKDVLDCSGHDKDATEVDKVLALLNYYSILEFEGCERVISHEEVLKELEMYEIPV